MRFVCVACGKVLTPELEPAPGPLVRPGYDDYGPGPSTVAQGFFAIDPEPFGAPFVTAKDQEKPPYALPGLRISREHGFVAATGPRNTIVLHPEDAEEHAPLLPHPDPSRSNGCCGPTGDGGWNRICPCGAEVGTLLADCYGAHELHLHPDRVRATQEQSAQDLPPGR